MNIAKLIELYPELKSVPQGTTLVPQNSELDGFFPVCRGRFDSKEGSAVDLLIVGQDFGTKEDQAKAEVNGEKWSGSFSRLAECLSAAEVDKAHCFFTNSLLCVREKGPSSGKSPAWGCRNYVEACADAFTYVLKSLHPSGIVFCGAPNLRFVELLGVDASGHLSGHDTLMSVYRCERQFRSAMSIGRWTGCVAFSPHWSYSPNFRDNHPKFPKSKIMETWRKVGRSVRQHRAGRLAA